MQLSSLTQKFNSYSFKTKGLFALDIQRVLSHILFVIFGPLMSFMVFKVYGIKISNLKEIRKKYKSFLSVSNGPVLICSNHLTLVDSTIQSICFNSIFGYLADYRSLPWNLPEKTNFYNKLSLRIICYLGKCIPVVRGASKDESKKSLNQMLHVLNKGDVISIFPEGKRSRSGFVDSVDFSYGVGQIMSGLDNENINVICLYMKGKHSGGFADYPIKGEEYYFEMEMITPKSELKGLRKVRDYSTQVITKLVEMEKEYFSK
jgi:1-acyl-sn-glycerol-3-phosphate acyltransferase